MSQRKFQEIFPKEDNILGYICGLLATDGCMNKNEVISISLHKNDITTLQWLNKTLNDKERKLTEKGNSFSLNMKNPLLYNYCLNMGITPRKSFTLDVKLDNKSNEFKWAFLRGAIDGDGTIHVGRDLSRSSVRLFSVSEKFLFGLKLLFSGSVYFKDNARGFNKNNTGAKIGIIEWRATLAQNLLKNLPDKPYMVNRKSIKMNLFKQLIRGNGHFSPTEVKNKKFTSLSEATKGVNSPVKPQIVRQRMKAGWSLEEAISLETNAKGTGRFIKGRKGRCLCPIIINKKEYTITKISSCLGLTLSSFYWWFTKNNRDLEATLKYFNTSVENLEKVL